MESLNDNTEILKRAEYNQSFKIAAVDYEIINLTEEGLEDYLKILDSNESDRNPGAEILTY
jgi:hypothetical protein